MHVLVVEDDARLAEALARILQDNGYATDVVHDGEAGVQYGGTGTYDVIILDVMLPKADGFTVAQRLRRAHVSTPSCCSPPAMPSATRSAATTPAPTIT